MHYAVQDAPFLFAVQIIVYTGAILMLFLFVLMLVGVDASDSLVETMRGQRRWPRSLLGLGFAGLLGHRLRQRALTATAVGLAEANADGNVQGIAPALFTKYVFAFEVTSALLITAALGRDDAGPHRAAPGRRSSTQPERMRARFAAPASTRARRPARASTRRPPRWPRRRCCPTAGRADPVSVSPILPAARADEREAEVPAPERANDGKVRRTSLAMSPATTSCSPRCCSHRRGRRADPPQRDRACSCASS